MNIKSEAIDMRDDAVAKARAHISIKEITHFPILGS